MLTAPWWTDGRPSRSSWSHERSSERLLLNNHQTKEQQIPARVCITSAQRLDEQQLPETCQRGNEHQHVLPRPIRRDNRSTTAIRAAAVSMWANQRAHQRHAELAAPTFAFSLELLFNHTHAHVHTHTSTAYLSQNETIPRTTANQSWEPSTAKGLH